MQAEKNAVEGTESSYILTNRQQEVVCDIVHNVNVYETFKTASTETLPPTRP